MNANHSQSDNPDLKQLVQKIEQLENRMSKLEKAVEEPIFQGFTRSSDHAPAGPKHEESAPPKESMESRMGEHGMAWLGNIVLMFGILYLSQYLQKNSSEVLFLVFGTASVALVYSIGFFTRISLPHMSRLFIYNGHLLLYIQAMRICLFEGSRVIDNPILAYALILAILATIIYLAYRNDSQILAVIGWMMAITTAIASDSIHFMLSILVGVTGTSIFFLVRKGWWNGLIIAMILVYFTFLMWVMGNPFVSKSFAVISDHQSGYVYMFICALAYSFLALLPKSGRVSERFLNASILLNGLSFSVLFIIMSIAFFSSNYSLYFGLIAAFCLGYSIFLQARAVWKTIAELYAIYSFVALSIAIAGIFEFPLAYFLLSIQSLLVISMALWFRSRFIVIMNTLLFAGLLIAYLTSSESLAMSNFSFAIVALVTARVMNWKKQRLEIRTELIRNIYLFTGAVMILFSLHEAVPAQFVTLSWVLSAVVFFVLSVVIKNMKYRWLSIITMVVAVFYLFIVDLNNISLGYRIVALMFIAAISLGISIFYSRRLKHKQEE